MSNMMNMGATKETVVSMAYLDELEVGKLRATTEALEWL